ncbi:MAG: hypothetical protein ABIF88_03400 [archaeon]
MGALKRLRSYVSRQLVGPRPTLRLVGESKEEVSERVNRLAKILGSLPGNSIKYGRNPITSEQARLIAGEVESLAPGSVAYLEDRERDLIVTRKYRPSKGSGNYTDYNPEKTQADAYVLILAEMAKSYGLEFEEETQDKPKSRLERKVVPSEEGTKKETSNEWRNLAWIDITEEIPEGERIKLLLDAREALGNRHYQKKNGISPSETPSEEHIQRAASDIYLFRKFKMKD